MLFMASFSYSTMDYIIQENAWSLSGSTSQWMKQTTSKVSLGDASKSIYILTNFHASDELLRGPDRVFHNYIIDLRHNYMYLHVITTRK